MPGELEMLCYSCSGSKLHCVVGVRTNVSMGYFCIYMQLAAITDFGYAKNRNLQN